jgi:methyl coenzyme M reductase subunit C
VGKPSVVPHPFEVMKGFTLEKNPINVENVAKPSAFPVPFENMKEFILERNLMIARSVERPSFLFQAIGDT